MEIEVASLKKITPGKMAGVEQGNNSILVANVGGAFYAIKDICTHMGCNLSGGVLKGENVTCPCHSSMFNVKTGAVIGGPARKPETTYKTRVDGDKVFVDL
jgi:3-phenylpropionate/trans-cinnamate dioxygenase ferredoxin component